ncbi:MAG TPA: rod-binding protein [Xanthobacteraceae bacterium]|nr:rod-binding protein [Xanthobacteraceae bacterium]
MSAAASSTAPAALSRYSTLSAVGAARSPHPAAAKAKAAAEEFETVYLTTVFNEMFSELKGDGPFGSAGSAGVWRSFLAEEYAKSFAQAGGIGIGAEVYRTLLGVQEATGK